MSENESRTTVDHAEIQRWVEKRGGVPARVKGTGDSEDAGVLRINFRKGDPDPSDEDRLEEISWNEFFDEFEKSNLAFLYQEKKADGEASTFFKFIHR